MESARRFVTSMCEDHQGRLWVASDNGLAKKPEGCVECFDPSAPELHQWTEFTTKDGLGDNVASAVACDHQGRIWVGHTANHGVSVFNGQRWQNYCNSAIPSSASSLLGPLGERVSHITICPTDSDIWIATDCGLTRYSVSKGTWSYHGLPAGEPSSLTFDHKGNVYVGTKHDGIAVADAADNYQTWRRATALDEKPTVRSGDNLPSNVINDILAANDGTIYAATEAGLAWSKDSGQTWQFVRGMDWADQNRHRGIRASGTQTQTVALAEDDCTCLAETPTAGIAVGNIYVGHRDAGIDVFDPARNRVDVATDSIFAKAIVNSTGTYVGSYPGPGGVTALHVSANAAAVPSMAINALPVAFPSGAPTSNFAELTPEIEVINLKDLYENDQFEEASKECGCVEQDQRYSAWQPQILYIHWLAERKLGNLIASHHLRDSFLERYPRHALAADLHFDRAVFLLESGRYVDADKELATIEDYFPKSRVAEKAMETRKRIQLATAMTSK
jgi:hypothetical protein